MVDLLAFVYIFWKKCIIRLFFYFHIILLAFQDKVLNYKIFLNRKNYKLYIEKMIQEKKQNKNILWKRFLLKA